MKLKKICVLILILLTSCQSTTTTQNQKYSRVFINLFDTPIQFISYEKSQKEFDNIADDVYKDLEEYYQLFDIYHEYPDLTNIATLNKEAGSAPVKVDPKILDMLLVAKENYTISAGKMNIALGTVLTRWHDFRDLDPKTVTAADLPDETDLKERGQHTHIEDLILDLEAKTVFFKDPDLKLDVGGFAKGYALEKTFDKLESLGHTTCILNMGGDIKAIGTKPDGNPWTIAITNPSDPANYLDLTLAVNNFSVFTSGNYERFVLIDGIRYHHIIDPVTFYPAQQYKSITVITERPSHAEMLTKFLFNTDLESGLAFINAEKNTEAMWIDINNKEFYSDGFMQYKIPNQKK